MWGRKLVLESTHIRGFPNDINGEKENNFHTLFNINLVTPKGEGGPLKREELQPATLRIHFQSSVA